MANPMKVLIAYDGSPCADAALEDLQRAGLPNEVEAIVLSIADLWALPQEEALAPPPLGASTIIREARATAVAMLESAKSLADSATNRLKQLFPHWQIRAECAADSPAWAIILKAEEWGADLIVVGSHGYSSLGRLVLGSVSQTVVTHAPCSVRIARSRTTLPNHPLRILVGIDGSSESDLAVQTVAGRIWPKGTDIRLVMVVNSSLLDGIHEASSPTKGEFDSMDRQDDDELDNMIGKMLDNSAAIVRQNPTGALVSTSLLSGDPKRELVQMAESWGADSIFVGSRGLNRWERLLLGSVSCAIAARAQCPVEVVRSSHAQNE